MTLRSNYKQINVVLRHKLQKNIGYIALATLGEWASAIRLGFIARSLGKIIVLAPEADNNPIIGRSRFLSCSDGADNST